MKKTELKKFISKNYYDIEKHPLPKRRGEFPSKERLMNLRQMNEFLDKLESKFGNDASERIELSFAKISVKKDKNYKRYFYIDFDNWKLFFKVTFSIKKFGEDEFGSECSH